MPTPPTPPNPPEKRKRIQENSNTINNSITHGQEQNLRTLTFKMDARGGVGWGGVGWCVGVQFRLSVATVTMKSDHVAKNEEFTGA